MFEFGTGLSYSSFEVLAIEQTPVKCIDGTELEHTVAAALYQPHEAQYVLNLSVAVRNVGPRSGAVSILGTDRVESLCWAEVLEAVTDCL